MAQEISTSDVRGLVHKFRAENFWPQSLVQSIATKGEHGAAQWTLSRPLTSPERNRLKVEAGQIDEILVPAHLDEIKRNVSQMLLAWPVAASTTDKEMMAKVSVYCAALTESPGWAINEVCGHVVKGIIDRDHAFAPTAPELAAYVRKAVQPFRDRKVTYDRMLAAKVEMPPDKASAERTEKVKRLMAGWVREGTEI